MKTIKALFFSAIATVMLVSGINVSAYEVDRSQMLGANDGSSQLASPNYILLHETANPNAGGLNNAKYMKRTWFNAYTAYVVGEGKAYQVGEDGYVQYGAGSYGNANSPVQIELDHTTNKAQFDINYKVYVELARDKAKKYNIPLTLDTPFPQRGIKSHRWITDNVWGDHTDPYGYLASMGVSKEKLAHDLANGVGGAGQTVKPNKPAAPKPNKPATPKTHDQAVAATPARQQGNAFGKLDYFNGFGKDQIRVAGWLVPNTPYGNIGNYAYVLFMEHGTNKELTRVQSQGIARPDVKAAYGYQGGKHLGFDVTVNTKQFKGKKVDVILRRANATNGEKAVNDVRINDIYLSF